MAELSLHAWIVIAVIATSVVAMLRADRNLPVYLVFVAGAALLVLTGCIDLGDALEGFRSSTVALLFGVFVVIAGLENTGVFNVVAARLLGSPKSLSAAIVKLMVPVSLLSAFILNVGLVAMFTSVVKRWAKELGIPASKLLLPLLYAAKTGGLLLVIGVSSNLLVVEQYEQATGNSLSVTFPFLAGLFCVLVCVVCTVALKGLLPVRKSPDDEFRTSEMVTELKVPADNQFVGECIGDCAVGKAFLGDGDAKLLGIVRFDGEVVRNVSSDEFLMGGDTLLLAGDKRRILDLGKSLGFVSSLLDQEFPESNRGRRIFAVSVLLLAIIIPLFCDVSSALCFVVAALAMVAAGCVKPWNLLSSINGEIIVVIGCSVAYSNAIESTGLARLLADSVLSWCGTSPFVAFSVICALCMLLSDFLSGYVCPVLLTPIAMNLSASMGANPLTFIMGLIISCSCCVATPLGDGSKILTYVSGGYRFSDFLRIGIPMNIILLAANIFISTLLFPL